MRIARLFRSSLIIPTVRADQAAGNPVPSAAWYAGCPLNFQSVQDNPAVLCACYQGILNESGHFSSHPLQPLAPIGGPFHFILLGFAA